MDRTEWIRPVLKSLFLLELMASFLGVSSHFTKINDRLIDSNGNQRIFHGINVVRKSAPFLPDKIDRDLLIDMGLNVIRLGFTWAAVEPAPFDYNRTYLKHLRAIIDSLSPEIFVILDMHQDMLSSKFGSYDSIPIWLLSEFPNSTKPYPWPFDQPPRNVFFNYLTSQCSEAFEHLYSNHSGAMLHFAEMWKQVVKSVDDAPNLLGSK